MIIKIKNKKINLGDVRKVSGLEEGIGLMFSRREKARILLFEFQKPTKLRIHSLFVFFPFIAIWLDKENKVVDIKKVNPFTFAVSSKKPFFRLVEIPINKRYEGLVSTFIDDERFK